jgi:hypothetical protein
MPLSTIVLTTSQSGRTPASCSVDDRAQLRLVVLRLVRQEPRRDDAARGHDLHDVATPRCPLRHSGAQLVDGVGLTTEEPAVTLRPRQRRPRREQLGSGRRRAAVALTQRETSEAPVTEVAHRGHAHIQVALRVVVHQLVQGSVVQREHRLHDLARRIEREVYVRVDEARHQGHVPEVDNLDVAVGRQLTDAAFYPLDPAVAQEQCTVLGDGSAVCREDARRPYQRRAAAHAPSARRRDQDLIVRK